MFSSRQERPASPLIAASGQRALASPAHSGNACAARRAENIGENSGEI
jgi:hypothetical protein